MAESINEQKFKELAAKFATIKLQSESPSESKNFKDEINKSLMNWAIPKLKSLFEQPYETAKTTKLLWEFLHEYRELSFKNVLSPTAQAQNPLMLLLCEIAPEICGKNQPIEMLFKNIHWETTNSTEAPSLDASIPLETIINTHILSDDGGTLIPVISLVKKDFITNFCQNKDDDSRHYNYYHPDYKTITNHEIKRLMEHSQTTEELCTSYENELHLLNKTNNDLYSNLVVLCRKLQRESASGRGGEYEAGEGAFVAIYHFSTFYNQLSKDEIDRIPSNLKYEITLLIDVASNWKGNMKNRVDSCIASRKSELEKNMDGHKDLLLTIILDNTKINTQLAQAAKNKENISNQFQTAIQTNTYTSGSDKLTFNRQLLNNLQLNFEINKPTDLDLLLKLNPEELRELLSSNPALHSKILDKIGILENFIILSPNIDSDRMDVLLSFIGKKFKERFLTRTPDIASLFDGLFLFNQPPIYFLLYLTHFNIDSTLNTTYTTQEHADIVTVFQEQNKKLLEEFDWFPTIEEIKSLLTEHSECTFHKTRIIQKYWNKWSFYENIDIEENRQNMIELFELAKQHHVDINSLQIKGETPITYVLKKYLPLDYIQFFLDNGFNIDAGNATGNTPLLFAINRLIEAEKSYANLIHFKVKEGPIGQLSLENIHYLLENGASFNSADSNGETPLMKLVQEFSDMNFIQLFLKYGIFINSRSNSGKTALHYAASKPGGKKVVELLVTNGADLHAKDEQNQTPLVLALMADSFINAEYLIECGANCLDTNQHGTSAMLIIHRRTGMNLLSKAIDKMIEDKKDWVNALQIFLPSENIIDQYKNHLIHTHQSTRDHFITTINITEITAELMRVKISCERNKNKIMPNKVNHEKSKALDYLLSELVIARKEFIQNQTEDAFCAQNQFTVRVINAIEKTKTQLSKHRSTAWIIIKCILCLLIVPAIIFGIRGELNFKTRSENLVNNLEDKLLKHGFFKPNKPKLQAELNNNDLIVDLNNYGQ